MKMYLWCMSMSILLKLVYRLLISSDNQLALCCSMYVMIIDDITVMVAYGAPG